MSHYYNDLAYEERAYREWQRKQKTRILGIQNPTRRQEEWNKVFPKIEKPDDSYLEGDIF